MTRRLRSASPRAGAAVAALVLVAALAATSTTNGASASAAPTKPHGTAAPKAALRVVIGQTAAASYGQCSPANLTALAGTSAGAPTYDVPGAGVLTSVSTRGNVNGGSFRAVVYSTPGPNRTLVAKSEVLTIAPNVVNTYPVRLPVTAAATLGYNTATAGSGCSLLGMSPDDVMVMDIVNPAEFSTFYDYAVVDKTRPNISAVWESDDDGDGYGDVSQDACPRSALAHEPCPAPETVLAKKPKRHTTQREVRFAFTTSIAGATFQCKLDGQKRWKACESPFKTRLSFGKHGFRVRAVSPAGITDATPAKVKFRIVRV
jgi:hypothetical protein